MGAHCTSSITSSGWNKVHFFPPIFGIATQKIFHLFDAHHIGSALVAHAVHWNDFNIFAKHTFRPTLSHARLFIKLDPEDHTLHERRRRLEYKFNIIKINWKFHLNFLKRNPQKRILSAGDHITILKSVHGILVRHNKWKLTCSNGLSVETCYTKANCSALLENRISPFFLASLSMWPDCVWPQKSCDAFWPT